MWYVIQTITGKEEELIEMIRKLADASLYASAFSIKRECLRKAEDKKYKLYMETMFPSYVFIVTEHPQELFFQLKRVPRFSRLLHDEEHLYYTVAESEQEFLENLMGDEPGNVVKISLAEVDEEGQVVSAENPLGQYLDKVVRQRLRKRYVCIEEYLLGSKKRMRLNIRLEEDEIERE